jgi:hypothetical protein
MDQHKGDHPMENLNFAAKEIAAKNMTADQLNGAIADCLATLPHADAIDKITGDDNGGRYRDEISVYRRELARRGSKPAPPSVADALRLIWNLGDVPTSRIGNAACAALVSLGMATVHTPTDRGEIIEITERGYQLAKDLFQ